MGRNAVMRSSPKAHGGLLYGLRSKARPRFFIFPMKGGSSRRPGGYFTIEPPNRPLFLQVWHSWTIVSLPLYLVSQRLLLAIEHSDFDFPISNQSHYNFGLSIHHYLELPSSSLPRRTNLPWWNLLCPSERVHCHAVSKRATAGSYNSFELFGVRGWLRRALPSRQNLYDGVLITMQQNNLVDNKKVSDARG